jgi:hypothetical protein
VPRPAERLHGVGGDLHRHVRREALGRRTEEGEVSVLALALRGRDTSCRAASSFMAMSAIMNWMPWNDAIGLPNCCRSFT